LLTGGVKITLGQLQLGVNFQVALADFIVAAIFLEISLEHSDCLLLVQDGVPVDRRQSLAGDDWLRLFLDQRVRQTELDRRLDVTSVFLNIN
jgi:hypothetical protein